MKNQDSIKHLTEKVYNFTVERDWEQFHSPETLAVALSVEASELLENFLWQPGQKSFDLLKDKKRRQEIVDEVGDIVAYLLEFCRLCKIDPGAAMLAKLKKAAIKYPVAKAKGKSTKYSRLK